MFDINFVVGMGRSGTVLLSKLLQQIGDVYCLHEPDGMITGDKKAYLEMYYNKNESMDYFSGKRYEFIISNYSDGIKYVEVNGYLRLNINALKKIFPEAKFFHIVRDPRLVIRSMMSKKKSILNEIQRACSTIKFKMCCKMWADENREIRKYTDNLIRLEDITSDYGLYKKQVLEPLGTEQPESVWKKIIEVKHNQTMKFVIPEYRMWQKSQKRYFKLICGKEAKGYGYEI